tara:strand:- start:306 stop:707 length:402 start_codon:yes stop_codon:yes gene_type:complete
MTPGTHGSTFGGNPLAMRSANAVLDLLLEDNFLRDLKEKIIYFDNKMDALLSDDKKGSSVILCKKGSGMLRGFQLNQNFAAGDFGNISRKKGLLLVGAAENTIRLLPPLNTFKEEIDQAFKILSEVVKEIKKN